MSEYGQLRDQIKSALILADSAHHAADAIGSAIHSQWGNVTAPGEHQRNAAIFTWRHVCGQVDKIDQLTMEAGASAADAVRLENSANAPVNATLAEVYRHHAARNREAARRLMAEAAALYDVEVKAGLEAAAALISAERASTL